MLGLGGHDGDDAGSVVARHVDAVLGVLFDDDGPRRHAVLVDHLAADFVFVDPTQVTDGVLGLDAAFNGLRHDAQDETALVRTSGVEVHHGYFSFSWARTEAGRAVESGTAFGWTDDEDRPRRLVAFIGPADPHRT